MVASLSKGPWATGFLLISIVVMGACNHQRSTPEATKSSFSEVSQINPSLIGKQITIRGMFSLWGKVGPYVSLDNRQEVYLESKGSFTWGKPYSDMDGKLIEASGVLNFYHEPPSQPMNQAVQHVPDYFYFYVETTQLRLIDR